MDTDPPSLLFGLRCVVWYLSLQAVGWGQVLMPKCQTPGEFLQMNAPHCVRHQCLHPQGGPLPPLTSTGDPPRLAGRSGPGFYQITAFALGPGMSEILCVLFKSKVSISPNPVELLQSSPAGFQSQMLWGLLSLVLDPWTGVPNVGLRALTPVGEPLQI